MFDVELKELPPLTVAAVRHVGPYHTIGEAFYVLYDWAGGMEMIDETTRVFALAHDNPKTTAPDRCRADACLTVPDGTTAEPPVSITTLPAGLYAVFRHKGPYDGLEAAYGFLRGWVESQGRSKDDRRPCVEEYLNDPSTVPPEEYLTDIWMPVA